MSEQNIINDQIVPATEEPQTRLNQDTGLLKLIAVLCMVIDHVGAVLLPEVAVLRWIGRLAFPLFCHCLVVGLMHTRSVKRYLTRLLIMAVIAQPLFIWSFYNDDFWGNFHNLNTLFTLFLGLYAMWGIKEQKGYRFVLGMILLSIVPCDYGIIALVYMLIFYLCRNKPLVGAGLVVLYNLQNFVAYPVDHPLYLQIGPVSMFCQFAAVLSIPLIFLRTHTKIRLNKWFFYVFYPLHLLIICLIRQWLIG